jgi:putative transposase
MGHHDHRDPGRVYEPDAEGKRSPECLYGSLKMWAHLRREGIPVARCTVERIMRANGWRGVTRARRTPCTTEPDPAAARAPDLVNRGFKVAAPNLLVVADFTYVPMVVGFGYTAFVVDAYAGLIGGWECSLTKDTAFVERALRHAAAHRARQGHLFDNTIHHSDAGSQYTAIRFGETLMLAGLRPSVGSVGDAYDTRCARRRSVCTRPSACVTVRRFGRVRSTPWPTWRTSPPRGWPGTTGEG